MIPEETTATEHPEQKAKRRIPSIAWNRIGIVLAVIVFAWFIWPTPWQQYKSGTEWLRINRLTGEADALYSDGWRVTKQGWLWKWRQPQRAAQVKRSPSINFDDISIDKLELLNGTFYLNFYNGTDEEINSLTIPIVITHADDSVVTRDYTFSGLYCTSKSQGIGRCVVGDMLASSDTWGYGNISQVVVDGITIMRPAKKQGSDNLTPTKDAQLQAMYDEAKRRDLFKSDPDFQSVGHVLRARGLVAHDETQGGIVSITEDTLPALTQFRERLKLPRNSQLDMYVMTSKIGDTHQALELYLYSSFNTLTDSQQTETRQHLWNLWHKISSNSDDILHFYNADGQLSGVYYRGKYAGL